MKNYQLRPTKNPDWFRNVNLEGDWREYGNPKTGEYRRGLTTILGRVWPKGEGFYTALKNSTPEEWDKKTNAAADQGDAVHQLIEVALSGVNVNMATDILAEDNKTLRKPTVKEWLKYLSFVSFFNLHGIIVLGHEETGAHEKFVCTIDQIWILTKSCGLDKKYCACADFLNLKGINDVKTGKGLYANHKVQIAMETRADHGFGEIKYTMLLHLNGTNRGWSVKFFDQTSTELNYARGMCAIVIDDDTYKVFDPAKDIEEIPETAELIFGDTLKLPVVPKVIGSTKGKVIIGGQLERKKRKVKVVRKKITKK